MSKTAVEQPPIYPFYCRGTLAIQGSVIDATVNQLTHTQLSKIVPPHCMRNREKRDGQHYHITLIHGDELKTLIQSTIANQSNKCKTKERAIEYLIDKCRKSLKLNKSKHGIADPIFFDLGFGKLNQNGCLVFYKVIVWPQLSKFRKTHHLDTSHFNPHITVGFEPLDLHNANKGISTLMNVVLTDDYILRLFEFIQKRLSTRKDYDLICQCLDLILTIDSNNHGHLCYRDALLFRANLYGQRSELNLCMDDILAILKSDPFYPPALITKAIALTSMNRPFEATETFHLSETVIRLNSVIDPNCCGFDSEPQYKEYLNRLKQASIKCGADLLMSALNARVRITITFPFNIVPLSFNDDCKQLQFKSFKEIRWHSVTMPRNFSWVINRWLAGVSIPKSAEQIRALAHSNIGLVVTMFEEALPKSLFKGCNESIINLHVSTKNYSVPTLTDMQKMIVIAEEFIFVKRKAVIMHCGGGKGRAGTALACFLLKWGLDFDTRFNLNDTSNEDRTIPPFDTPQMTVTQVISHLRHVRPGSIETSEQENFIKTYLNSLWTNVGTDALEEKKIDDSDASIPSQDPTGLNKYPTLSNAQLKILKSKDYPELIIMAGIPGSGKTLFTQMLSTLNRQQSDNITAQNKKITIEWRLANQDELGKKEHVELKTRHWMRDKTSNRIGLVIDRCNVLQSDRRYWLDFTFKPKKAVCVFLNYDTATCQQRIAHRKNHQTIQNRSRKATDRLAISFAKKLEIPTKKEGFSQIITIDNTQSLLQCCEELGCDPSLIKHFIPTQFFKFPRTQHLWDTGAATRDDLLVPPKKQSLFFGPLGKIVYATEKVDGANLGISLSANYEIQCQHRGQSVTYETSVEYSKLKHFLNEKQSSLCQILEPERHILFGEWCQVKHSIEYDNLPSYFLVFDLYDRFMQSFVSRSKLEQICDGKFVLTRIIAKTKFDSKDELEKLMNETMSQYRGNKKSGPIEGLYLKIDDDIKGINTHRCKLVRTDFVQGITDHWTRGKIMFNNVIPQF